MAPPGRWDGWLIFKSGPSELGLQELDFGRTVQPQIPGGPEVMLCQPRYHPPALTR